MSKDLDYYLALPYTIEVVPIPEEDGGGFMARLPQVGRYAIIGDGETVEEALENLEISKRERFAEYIEEGVEIPEPEPEEDKYSGRFLVRIPKSLHRNLVLKAKKDGVSLNQYIVYLLSASLKTKEPKEAGGVISKELRAAADPLPPRATSG